MYQKLASKLVMHVDNTPNDCSQPVAVGEANAVQIETTMFRLTATNVVVWVQESNDLENWSDVASANETITAEGYVLGTKRTGIAAAYVRLRYVITGSTGQIGILAAGLNISEQ